MFNFKKKFFNLWFFSFFLILFLLLYLPITVHAAGPGPCPLSNGQPYCPGNSIRLQVPIPGASSCTYTENDQQKTMYCIADFPTYIKTLYKFFISIVGILAVIMIMVGGFQWLLAAGNAQKIAGAKTTILSAIMGLVLALTSYTILYIINPDILKLTFEPKKVELNNENPGEYCNSYSNIFFFNDDRAECGKTYQFREEEDRFCMGVECAMPAVEACIGDRDSREFQCLSSITIDDTQMGYGQNIWKAKSKVLSTEDIFRCGNLYMIDKDDREFAFGTLCSTGSSCVVDISRGAVFDKRYEEAQEEVKVGRLIGAKCLPGATGSW